MGLFAGGAFQDPLREGADLVTGSTQKSLPGPIGGLILTNRADLGERIFDVSTRLVSNYENNRAAALAMALTEMLAFGAAYASACISNAQALARALAERGFRPLGASRGYTQTNQVVLDAGDEAPALAEAWEESNIITTAMHLPSARPTRGRPADGIRIGVQELTRLGMGPVEMAHIADLMRRTADGDDRRQVGQAAVELVRAFPTVYYSFEHPKP
jgi:glycine hydroxymethyltransferase